MSKIRPKRSHILKVGDFEALNFQLSTKLIRAINIDFTTVSPIFYIHCYRVVILFSSTKLLIIRLID